MERRVRPERILLHEDRVEGVDVARLQSQRGVLEKRERGYVGESEITEQKVAAGHSASNVSTARAHLGSGLGGVAAPSLIASGTASRPG
jgi:hypothetical protein